MSLETPPAEVVLSRQASPNLLTLVYSSPVFKRLRHIRQLGALMYVDPAANHTRADHSRGTADLVREVFEVLDAKCPPTGAGRCPERLQSLAAVAGACHDLGHGPYSHEFDHFLAGFMPADFPFLDHEARSIMLTQHILRDHLTQVEMEVVCSLIDPKRHHWPGAVSAECALPVVFNDGGGDIELYKLKEAQRLVPWTAAWVRHLISAPDKVRPDVDRLDYIVRDSRALNLAGVKLLEDARAAFLEDCAVVDGEWVPSSPRGREAQHVLMEQRRLNFAHIYQAPATAGVSAALREKLQQEYGCDVGWWTRTLSDPLAFCALHEKTHTDLFERVPSLRSEVAGGGPGSSSSGVPAEYRAFDARLAMYNERHSHISPPTLALNDPKN